MIFDPCAFTVPSGSRSDRRKECAMADRAYPSTSAGWQNTQRLAPLGALGSGSGGCFASCFGSTPLTDWLRPERILRWKSRRMNRPKAIPCCARLKWNRRTIGRTCRQEKTLFILCLPAGLAEHALVWNAICSDWCPEEMSSISAELGASLAQTLFRSARERPSSLP